MSVFPEYRYTSLKTTQDRQLHLQAPLGGASGTGGGRADAVLDFWESIKAFPHGKTTEKVAHDHVDRAGFSARTAVAKADIVFILFALRPLAWKNRFPAD